jgi:hypothetical protein
MSLFLSLENITLTLWAKFERSPVFNTHEKLVCMIEGSEKFMLAQSLSPSPDFSLSTTLNRGDCLYIPSLHWYKSETVGEDMYPQSGFVTLWFRPASELAYLIAKSIINLF